MRDRPLRILHVASHIGNIGDDASHIGLAAILEKSLGPVDIDRLDIRKTYQSYQHLDRWKFDTSFADHLNSYDLALIGGGSYLDYSHAGTHSGATIDIPPSVVDAIKTPTIICSVSCRPRSAHDVRHTETIRAYLETLIANANVSILVRNDGTSSHIKDCISSELSEQIPTVLDSGFFYQNDGGSYRAFPGDYIAINTTSDQLGFFKATLEPVAQEYFDAELARFVQMVIDKTDYNIAFAPHIVGDIKAIQGPLKYLDSYQIASRVAVMPYSQGQFGCDQVFSGYRNAVAVVGMRFHTNVCGLSMGVPTIGLAATERVVDLFNSLGMADYLFYLSDGEFADRLFGRLERLLMSPEIALRRYETAIKSARADTLSSYAQEFARHGL